VRGARIFKAEIAVALVVAGAALLGTRAAHADTLYVIEQLVVSVNAEADGSGERVGQIKSGDGVELIERQEDAAHIRLPSGQEGWVKASYLSESLPLHQQLAARTQELERVRKEKGALESDNAALRRAASVAAAAKPAPAVAAPAPAPTAAPPVEAPPPPSASAPDPGPQGAPPLFSASSVMPSRPSWLLAFGCALVALGIGFALGWRLLDRRIRAKYGGLRIY
jgi:Bacterial SH3 domain